MTRECWAWNTPVAITPEHATPQQTAAAANHLQGCNSLRNSMIHATNGVECVGCARQGAQATISCFRKIPFLSGACETERLHLKIPRSGRKCIGVHVISHDLLARRRMHSLREAAREDGMQFTKPNENDHETYDDNTSFCVRALDEYIRTCIYNSS
jgi:hypothetical protein